MSLPKFLFSETKLGDKYISCTSPLAIGRIHVSDGMVRVYLVKYEEGLNADAQMKLCLDMKNWYYFKFLKKR